MLIDSILQSLGCTAHVPTITVAVRGCHCDCRYVGRTTQRLQDRINQHIPKSIRTGHQQQKFQPQRNCKKTSTEINCDSAIGQHLLQNKTCANNFNTNQFSILAKARTQFHLSTLEATLIRILKPELCRQKGICLFKVIYFSYANETQRFDPISIYLDESLFSSQQRHFCTQTKRHKSTNQR